MASTSYYYNLLGADEFKRLYGPWIAATDFQAVAALLDDFIKASSNPKESNSDVRLNDMRVIFDRIREFSTIRTRHRRYKTAKNVIETNQGSVAIGSNFVVKVSSLEDASSGTLYFAEAVLHAVIDHPTTKATLRKHISWVDPAAVPSLWSVAVTRSGQTQLVYEKLDKDMNDLIQDLKRNSNSKQTDENIISIIMQIAAILEVLQEDLRFTNRDLHTGNVMVQILPSPVDWAYKSIRTGKVYQTRTKYRAYIIDVGQSCLVAGDQEINIPPSSYSDAFVPCTNKSYDLRMFTYMVFYHLFRENDKNKAFPRCTRLFTALEVGDGGTSDNYMSVVPTKSVRAKWHAMYFQVAFMQKQFLPKNVLQAAAATSTTSRRTARPVTGAAASGG